MALISATAKHETPVYRLNWRATGEDFHRMLESVKAIAGRKFDMASKTWSVPDLPYTAMRLQELGFAVEGLAGAPVPESAPALVPVVHAYANEWESIPIDRTQFPNLFPKQIGDLQFFTWAGGKALLVGEVGYGKTVSGLSWLKLRPDLRPALVVTRANIKTQWQKQWRKWVGDGSIPDILSGETPRNLRPDRSYIINREILHRWEEALSAIAPKCVIGDECQDFGNDKALKSVKGVDEDGNEVSKSVSTPVLRTQAFVNLCKQAPSLILLSATPFNSRVQQFFTVLNLLAPQQFPNKWAYQMRYCDAKPGAFGGWDFTGASNLQELHAKTARLMLFRDRDRTNATRHQTLILDTEISDKERAKELATISAWDVGGNLEGALLALEELSASHFKYKRKAVFQWLKGVVDNGEKVVVFCRHRAVAEAIAGSLGKKGVLYYGGMTDRARASTLEAFTKGSAPVLVANMEAAGVGLDGLQHVAHLVAFAEIPTSASTAKQCIGRVDRTGQTKDVDALFLCGEGTADELALQVLKERWGVLDCIRHGVALSDTQAVMEAAKKWKAKR